MVMTGRRTSTEPLVFFPDATKACKQGCGAAVSLAEKLSWLWVGRKSHRRRRRELYWVNHQCCIFFDSKEFREALPLPEPFHVMVCLLFLNLCCINITEWPPENVFTNDKEVQGLFLFYLSIYLFICLFHLLHTASWPHLVWLWIKKYVIILYSTESFSWLLVANVLRKRARNEISEWRETCKHCNLRVELTEAADFWSK